MTLFEVNGIDFSDRVVQKDYTVQQQDYFSSWVDGNLVTHRVIARTQISGTFTITFSREEDFDNFKTAIDTVKTNGGYCPVNVWVNNTKELASINAFVDFTSKNVWTTEDFGQDPEIAVVTVKITER